VGKVKHGYSINGKVHPLYAIWATIKRRCYKEKYKNFKNYGGRGIEVCNEWINSPKSFIEWALASGWKRGLSIDRINNDEGYKPSNCHFITLTENNHNTRLLRSTNNSGYRGVSRVGSKWRVVITINNKQIHLGYFDSPRIAGLRYDAEAYLNGDHRPRNFI